MTTVHDFEVKTIQGDSLSLSHYAGKYMLIVNVASKCGLTPQYEGLEALYREYKDQGLAILGFPCNQFAGQEPGTEAEIQTFCSTRYDVTFDLFAKIDVNGAQTHPLYTFLKKEAPGLLGSQAIKWNFTKFLVDPQGNVLKRFSPQDQPEVIQRELKHLLPVSK